MWSKSLAAVLAIYTGKAVADPGFPQGGGANSPGDRQHTILPNFPQNCMKLKEFGPPGGMRPSHPTLDPPLQKCCTRGESWGMNITYVYANKAAHSGFETQETSPE